MVHSDKRRCGMNDDGDTMCDKNVERGNSMINKLDEVNKMKNKIERATRCEMKKKKINN